MVSAIQQNNTFQVALIQPNNNVRQKTQAPVNTQFNQSAAIQNTNNIKNQNNENKWIDETKDFIQRNLILLLSSLAAIGLIIGGIAISSKGNKIVKEREINKSEENNNIKSPANSLETEKNQKEEIIFSMKVGNGGNSCHTMATLNAIRAYSELEGKAVPSWLNDRDNAKQKAFEIIRQANPDIGRVLQDNGYIQNSTGETGEIPKIILRHLNIPFTKFEILTGYTGGGMQAKVLDFPKLAQTLLDLEKKKLGILAMSGRGGHVITCYGFEQSNNFKVFIKAIQEAKKIQGSNVLYQLDKNPELLQTIRIGNLGKIQIYDQNRNTHESIELSDLLLGDFCNVIILGNN